MSKERQEPTLEQLQTIEQILAEAQAFGLRSEVQETAARDIMEDPSLDYVLAYQMALDEWIK